MLTLFFPRLPGKSFLNSLDELHSSLALLAQPSSKKNDAKKICLQGFDCSPVAFRYRPAISAECRYEWQSLSNHFKDYDYSALNLASLHIWLLANLNPRAHWAVWLHHHPLSPPNRIRKDKSHKENTYWTYGQRKMRSRIQKCFPITDSYRPFSKKKMCVI